MSLAHVAFLHLRRKKLRAALLIFSVALSLSLLIGINAGVDGLQVTYRDLVTNTLGYTDLMAKSNSSDQNFNMAQVQAVLGDSEVAAYSWRVQYWSPFVSKNVTFNSANLAVVVGAYPEMDKGFGEYSVASGNFTSIANALSNQSGSCIISDGLASRQNLTPGDTLFLGGYNASEPVPAQPSQTIKVTVAGVIKDYGRAYWFDAKNPDSYAQTKADVILNLNTTQNLFSLSPDEVNYVYVHVTDLANAENVKARLQSALGSDFTVADLKMQMLDSVKSSFGSFQTISYVIGGIALMIAAMLLLNSMLAGLNERRHEIGILRAIGASKGQIFGQFLTEAVPIAILGALASIPLSLLMAQAITAALPKLYVQNVGVATGGIKFSYSLSTLASCLAIGVTLTLLIALAPAFLASKTDIIRALHPQMRTFRNSKKWRIATPSIGLVLLITGLYMVRAGFLVSSWLPNGETLVGYAAALVGVVLLASLVLPLLSEAFSQFLKPSLGRASVLVKRNILLNRRRSVIAYGAFAISIALLVALSSLVTTAAQYDLSIARYGHGCDIQVWAYAPPNFADALKTVDGVRNVAAAGFLGYAGNNMTCNGHDMTGRGMLLIGVDSTDYFDVSYGVHLKQTLGGMAPNQVYAELVNEPDNVILQDALAENLSSGVGDEVTWLFTNQTGTYGKNLHVIATTDSVASASSTIYPSVVSNGYFSAIMRFQDMVPFRDPAIAGSNVDEFIVSIEPTSNMTRVGEDLAQLCKQNGYSVTVSVVQQRLAQAQASYSQAETLVLAITAFLVIVGAMGIAGSMAYTVYERKREIGLLSALGLDRRQNFVIIAGEALLLALIGAAVGFAAGLGLSLFTLQSIRWWSTLPAPPLVISPPTIAASIIIIVVSAVLSSVYPANRVMKLNVVEALRK